MTATAILLYERYGCCCIAVHTYTRISSGNALVPVCRTTTTAVHSTVVVCRFRVSRPAVPGTRHDTTLVSTSTPNENVDHRNCNSCWMAAGGGWAIHGLCVWWCCGGVVVFRGVLRFKKVFWVCGSGGVFESCTFYLHDGRANRGCPCTRYHVSRTGANNRSYEYNHRRTEDQRPNG